MQVINEFDSGMIQFYMALMSRLEMLCSMTSTMVDGELVPEKPTVTYENTTYIIPGVNYTLQFKNQKPFRIWVGANFERLFFIVRVKKASSEAKELFQFTFGGAETVGWHINYETIGDAETSIWATAVVPAPLLDFTPNPLKEDEAVKLSRDGGFWAVDVAMMTQSFIRTAQRAQIECADELPTPL